MAFGPPVPGFIDRVNFITSFFWQGCEAPFRLFCQFAQEPAGQAVAMLIGLDAGDIVKEFFRPAGLRSHRHGRKGPRGKKGLPELPDPNDAVAKRIPGQEAIAGRRWGSPTFYVFEFSDQLDRVAFNVAIIDVVTDTTYKGLLGILSVDPSNCPWVARGASHNENHPLLTGSNKWDALLMPIIDFEHGLTMTSYSANMTGSGRYLVTVEATILYPWGTWADVAIGIRDGFGGDILAESGSVRLEHGDTVTLNVAASVSGSIQPQWVCDIAHDQVFLLRGAASAVQYSQ